MKSGIIPGPVVITGGAGFIGCNLTHRLAQAGTEVVVIDSLSRPGSELNIRWLLDLHSDRVTFRMADIRSIDEHKDVLREAKHVFHFAAQVAVTTSIENPMEDFDVNLRGTVQLLEALRSLSSPPPLLFTSTNKVYGKLSDVDLRADARRYEPSDRGLWRSGIDEARSLDFYSPYGCSKGGADQYVLDYARTFGLRATVFRMSCIYGPRQFGNEDQGWVAHFLRCAVNDEPITIYGDGKQVRDVLFVDDLVRAFLCASAHMDRTSGEAFSIGGGPSNTLSLLELIALIGELRGKTPEVRFGEWRSGDQRYYVSNTAKFRAATGWSPSIDVRNGIAKLYDWILMLPGVECKEMKEEISWERPQPPIRSLRYGTWN